MCGRLEDQKEDDESEAKEGKPNPKPKPAVGGGGQQELALQPGQPVHLIDRALNKSKGKAVILATVCCLVCVSSLSNALAGGDHLQRSRGRRARRAAAPGAQRRCGGGDGGARGGSEVGAEQADRAHLIEPGRAQAQALLRLARNRAQTAPLASFTRSIHCLVCAATLFVCEPQPGLALSQSDLREGRILAARFGPRSTLALTGIRDRTRTRRPPRSSARNSNSY